MNLIFISSEAYPFSKTGGLADVSAGLPKALYSKCKSIKVFLPFYKCSDSFYKEYIPYSKINIKIGNIYYTANLYKTTFPNSKVEVFFIDNKKLFFRNELYTENGKDYNDNFSRFVFFQKACLDYIIKYKMNPDIIHINDWQTGLIPTYIKTIYKNYFKNTKVVFTIHNIAYQGIFWVFDMKLTNLPFSLFNWKQIEHYNKINLLKSGIVFSDAITTVSPTYSKEILTKEYGCGLEKVLKFYKTKLTGIVNGVDYTEWSPENDNLIPHQYSKTTIDKKTLNKNILLKKCGFYNDKLPLYGLVSRLVEQKGINFIIKNIEILMNKNINIVILGTGNPKIEKILNSFNEKYKGKFKAFIMFDNKLSHLIEAGSDIFLMPSLFEPCGLNQLYSLKYGTIPLVRNTGGLADTVIENKNENLSTGFKFNKIDDTDFLNAIDRSLKCYYNKYIWNNIILNAMNSDWSWDNSSKKYLSLYKKLLK